MFKEESIHIGILGGGQLGTLLIKSAIDFGLKISVMDRKIDAPAGKYTSSYTCGDPMNYDDVVSFGKSCNIVTIEKEAVNTDALRRLRDMGIKVFPSPELVAIVQDKYEQKVFLQMHDIDVVPGILINNKEELNRYLSRLPGCLKLRRNGYDGKGVMMINSDRDIHNAFDEPCILEEKIEIKQEISVIISRNVHGEVECYDPVEMIFDNEKHLLDFQVCPANITVDMTNLIYQTAKKIANKIELTGIMAIEMFITADNQLLVNELAPRPHNSGHHTIEACATSQYEQHIRAISGLPLGDTSLHCNASGMVNIIAREKPYELHRILGRRKAHLHYYGKNNSKPGRKIGHVTITEQSTEYLAAEIATIKNILN